MIQYKTIAESNNFIVLDQYNKFVEEPNAGYQTEGSLEREFIRDLQAQGYEYLQGLNNHDELIKNLRFQLQRLNNVVFSDAEWRRFLEEYLDKPSDTLIEKTRKIHDNYIYDFVLDDGHIQNIYLPMGFSHFKIEGRGLGSALILEFLLYYMTKPEYQLRVREEIYLDNMLDLF